MLRTLFSVSVLILANCNGNIVSSSNTSPSKNEGKIIVGLFSACNGTGNSSSSDESHMQLYSQIWHHHNNVAFEQYDVCQSIMDLSVIIENLLLNDQYFDQTKSQYKIRAFVVALENELMKHLYESVWHTRIPIFPLSDEEKFIKDGGNRVRSPFVFWYPGFNFGAMKYLAKWSDGRVLIVKDDDELAYTEIIDNFFRYLQDEKICYKSFNYDEFVKWLDGSEKYTIRDSNINNTISIIDEDGEQDGLLLVIDTNEPDNYNRLIKSPSYKKFAETIEEKYSIKFEVQTKDQLKAMVGSYQNETGHIITETARKAFNDDPIFRADAYSTFRLLDENSHLNEEKLNENLRNYNPITRNQGNMEQNRESDSKRCRKRCQAGQQNKYNRDEGRFKCVACRNNKYKKDNGFGQCEECPENKNADVTKTSCHFNYRYLFMFFIILWLNRSFS